MENTEYDKMTNEELQAEQASLSEQYDAYQAVVFEAYQNMKELGEEYEKITEILKQRNG